jgi:hypothetical protein
VTLNNTPVKDIILGGNIPDGSTTVTYFLTSAPAAAFPMTINVYEDKNGNGEINGGDNIIGTQNAPVAGQNYTATLSNVRSYAIITATSSTGCSFGYQTLAGSQAPLPVTFSSFTAVRKDESKVTLTWSTSMELNNRGFYVQRNLGNGTWKDVAFIFSNAAEGNSSINLNYSHTDINPHKGVSQYRILQVDLDGTGRYSVIRSVGGKGVAGSMLLFPNPSSNGAATLLFDTDGTRDVVVSDVSGRVVQQFRQVRGNNLPLKNLSTGFYTVQVRDVATGVTATERLIVQKP